MPEMEVHPRATFTAQEDRPQVLSTEYLSLGDWAKENPDLIKSRKMAYIYASNGRIPGAVKMEGVFPLTFIVPSNAYVLAPHEEPAEVRTVGALLAAKWRSKVGLTKRQLDALVDTGHLPLLNYGKRSGKKIQLIPADFPAPDQRTIVVALKESGAELTKTEIITYAILAEGLETPEIFEKYGEQYGLTSPAISQIASRLRRRGIL